MDGSSLTIIWHKNKLSVASRNVWFPTKKKNVYWDIVEQIGLRKVMRERFKGLSFALQGELCGPGIQGNKYKLDKPHLYIFGGYLIPGQKYMKPWFLDNIVFALAAFCESDQLHHVPILIRGGEGKTISDIGLTIDDWIKYATTKSDLNGESWNEGIVVRSLDNEPFGVAKMSGKRFSFKVINPEFLLQYGL
jgi:hypothetical protein